MPAHSIEMPSLTKHIENGMKTVRYLRPAKGPVLAHATLRHESASDNSLVIRKLRYIELGFDGVPLRLKCSITRESDHICDGLELKVRNCHVELNARVRKLHAGFCYLAATEADQ